MPLDSATSEANGRLDEGLSKPGTKAFRDEQAPGDATRSKEAVLERESVSFKEWSSCWGLRSRSRALQRRQLFRAKGIPIIVATKRFDPADRLTTIGRRRIAHTDEKEPSPGIADGCGALPKGFPAPRNRIWRSCRRCICPALDHAGPGCEAAGLLVEPHRTL